MLHLSSAIEFQPLRMPSGQLITQDNLSLFQKVLLSTDGTVTDLLALYTGEAINVQKLDQHMIAAKSAPIALECEPESDVLRRRVILRGQQKSYLYAESYFVFKRLSQPTQEALMATDEPIGLMWRKERTEMYRQVIACKAQFCADAAAALGVDKSVPILTRAYSIFVNRCQIGVICEKFPLSYFIE
ncbi:MAG: hypothetical protein COA42_15845 [Alteromonadaceae bacterium]|nr:MAG: hypothetical protein COA42_15845 [Alteromonadaceae bacterium]